MVRLLFVIGAAAFAALILRAVIVGDFASAGSWLLTDPWGLVTLVDLYIGFVLAALVIGLVERPVVALLWIAPIPILGNVWTLIWFAVRWPVLLKRLRG